MRERILAGYGFADFGARPRTFVLSVVCLVHKKGFTRLESSRWEWGSWSKLMNLLGDRRVTRSGHCACEYTLTRICVMAYITGSGISI